ncbi:GDSL-type esterase/lipase family protein [Saccharicrinis fermentans]|uniref:Polysaccharide deacetylase family sporulation protein PdaB n=1 Tax=Saccharicrinis fermentans DSM 9555 = JCM 21142 TaxID=869213 RepID=W7Y3D8_9BACT|nr:GDSL-type esterase/lipase family protein [Saccharicrinis fermentans]GAF02532.1 polysaccharide deacetylase family sporulation protein PdaB [Saccharicrinis fermentans DSM 9555 = JCM 21142]
MNLLLKLSSLLSVLLLICLDLIAQSHAYNLTTDVILERSFNKNRQINTNNFTFPNGKLKCLVMSFDDGPEHDRVLLEKLNKANIVGTFHLNSGRLGKKAEWLSSELGYDVHFVTESEVSSLYRGHEISGHTVHHIGLNNPNDSIIKFEVSSDLKRMNALIDNEYYRPVQGLAYPFGAYNHQTVSILEELGLKYARTVDATYNFEIPTSNFLTLNPTCHIFDALNYGSYFVNDEATQMQLLNIWGHSYEFHKNWELADSICNMLGNKEDIWYAQTVELVDYLTAIEELSYANDSVFNPSKDITVWVKNKNGDVVALLPGQSMAVHFQSSYAEVSELDRLYPPGSTIIKYHGDWTKNHYKERITTFKNSPLNFGDIVFIGNSITEQGGDWGEKLGVKNVRNRGIAGDVTDGVLKRINEITYYKPRTVFILIGINDLFNLYFQKEIPSPEYVANNILKITEVIHKGSPETKIYLQTILPTSKDYLMEDITKVNTMIRMHKTDSNYNLIDLFEVFVGDDGLIKPNLTSDGTHLNKLGYQLWVETINATINR